MIRIAIVDDDTDILNRIADYLSEFFLDEAEISSFSNGMDFFKNNADLSYDLILLDIEMPGIDGFEMAQTIKAIKSGIDIIFVSNSEHLVFKSFEYTPFRFVRKSCLREDIFSAAQSYKKKYYANNESCIFETDDGNIAIQVNQIIYFESMGHEICIHTVSEDLKLKRKRNNNISMKDIERNFEKKGFIRVHKSYIVNSHQIYRINRDNIILKNNAKIRVNPHRINEIKEAFQRFIMMEE